MEEGNNGTLELRPAASVDYCRRECLPDGILANRRTDVEQNARIETVTLLEELVKENDNICGDTSCESAGGQHRGQAMKLNHRDP